MRTLLVFAAMSALFLSVLSAREPGNPQSDFESPESVFRLGRNIHSVPASEADQARVLDDLAASGYGRLATNVNWTEDYLNNEQQFALLFDFVRRAKERGLDVWLYDENTYPSGMAGDILLTEHPEWEAEGIFFRQLCVTGPADVVLKNDKRTLWLIFAVPVRDQKPVLAERVDLSRLMQGDTLHWNAPEGEWIVGLVARDVLYQGFQAGTMRGPKARRYPSLLLPEVARRFVEVTHEKYAQELGAPLGTLFSATFTDEPSAMAQSYPQTEYGVYPWKENVSAEYEQRTGRKLSDDLPAIMLDAESFGQQCRCDYFRIIADFMSGSFFETLHAEDAAQKTLSSGHLLLEESLMTQTPLYGDIMACYRRMDMPGIDVLTGRPQTTRHYLYSSRLASSAAELKGGSDVMCENCPIDDPNGEPPTLEIRGVVHREMIGGVTRFCDYLQLAHEDSEGKKRFNTCVGRIASELDGGVRAARIAVYYPIEMVWTHFRPLPTWLDHWFGAEGGAPGARRVDERFRSVSDFLYDHQWEFSYLDAQGVIDSQVRDGRLVHGALAWDVVILPSVETLSRTAWQRLSDFARSGGTVIALETLPVNSTEEFPCAEYAEEAKRWNKPSERLFFLPDENAEKLREILLETLPREIDFEPSDGLLCAERSKNGYDVFFVVNDTPQSRDITVSLQGSAVENRIPRTGEIVPMKIDAEKKAVFMLHLEPYEGTVLKRIPR